MSYEPKPLSFGDLPASAVPPARKAPEAVRVPGALVFPESGPTCVSPAAPSRAEVRQLAFPPAPPAPVKSGTPAAAPSAVDFTHVRPVKPVATGPKPAFSEPDHPLLATARAAAERIAPQLFVQEEERTLRHLRRLLPFTRETVETWGSYVLDDCRALSQSCAGLTAEFNALRSAERLERVLHANEPASGILAKVRRRLAMSTSEQEVELRRLRTELEGMLARVRTLMPQVRADGVRLATQTLALSAVAQAAGRPPDSTFELLLEQRQGLLRAASTQMQHVPAQLKLIEDTAALQHAQCERVLNVTLSAVSLVRANRP